MADLARIKRNVAKMAAQNAPVEDIDGYITSEGVTIDDVRAFKTSGDTEQAAVPSTAVDLPDEAKQARDNYYSSGIYAGSMNPLGPIAKTIDAFASGAQRAPLMGWDDEAVAGARSLTGADYQQAQQEESAKKQAMRDQNPIASTAGELAGALATGGTIASTGATLAGKSLPVIGRTGAGALEGAAYGALTGAGEADAGKRLSGAGWGALIAGVTGAAASKLGDAMASRSARNEAAATAPSVDDLAEQSSALYQKARDANISIKTDRWDKLADNMQFAAGRINRDLRPKTAGIVEDVVAMKGKPVDLQAMDELRQTINQSLKTAEDQDARTLMRMKDMMDGFTDRATAEDIVGNVDGFNYLKEARDLWRKKSKTQAIEQMMDLADVDSAKYSQSGAANRDKVEGKTTLHPYRQGPRKGVQPRRNGARPQTVER